MLKIVFVIADESVRGDVISAMLKIRDGHRPTEGRHKPATPTTGAIRRHKKAHQSAGFMDSHPNPQAADFIGIPGMPLAR